MEDENFTTDPSAALSAEVFEDKSEEDTVVTLNTEVNSEGNQNDTFSDAEFVKPQKTVAKKL